MEPETENETELPAEAVEEIADASIAIAETEAAASIAIAEIHAETEQLRIATDAERDAELWQMREALVSAETTITELSRSLAEARAEVEALTVSEPLPSEIMTSEEVTDLTITPTTPNDISAEIGETLTEAIVESDAEKTEVLDLPPVLSVPKKGPIIQLV